MISLAGNLNRLPEVTTTDLPQDVNLFLNRQQDRIKRTVESFDDLARTFEAVAYGGRDASPPDLDTARREWPQVVARASRESGS